jgi:two-component system, OmpR family, response regulator MprA
MSHVLVVDDDPGIRTFLTLALEAEGYGVQTATNGIEALEDIHRSEPTVLLLDVQMPELDGPGVARRLHEQGSTVPIVVMTAAMDAGRRCQEMGADGCLAKPFSLEALFEVVERVHRDH